MGVLWKKNYPPVRGFYPWLCKLRVFARARKRYLQGSRSLRRQRLVFCMMMKGPVGAIHTSFSRVGITETRKVNTTLNPECRAALCLIIIIINLPLFGREWMNSSNSSYNCTPFLHSLLTKGKLRLGRPPPPGFRDVMETAVVSFWVRRSLYL